MRWFYFYGKTNTSFIKQEIADGSQTNHDGFNVVNNTTTSNNIKSEPRKESKKRDEMYEKQQ